MVGVYGWKADEDYSVIPEEKWCDLDYVAAWIKSVGYKPKTTIENLCHMILSHYDYDEQVLENGYFAIKDERKYPDNLMVYVPDIKEYVFASGGLEEFDYEC